MVSRQAMQEQIGFFKEEYIKFSKIEGFFMNIEMDENNIRNELDYIKKQEEEMNQFHLDKQKELDELTELKFKLEQQQGQMQKEIEQFKEMEKIARTEMEQKEQIERDLYMAEMEAKKRELALEMEQRHREFEME